MLKFEGADKENLFLTHWKCPSDLSKRVSQNSRTTRLSVQRVARHGATKRVIRADLLRLIFRCYNYLISRQLTCFSYPTLCKPPPTCSPVPSKSFLWNVVCVSPIRLLVFFFPPHRTSPSTLTAEAYQGRKRGPMDTSLRRPL